MAPEPPVFDERKSTKAASAHMGPYAHPHAHAVLAVLGCASPPVHGQTAHVVTTPDRGAASAGLDASPEEVAPWRAEDAPATDVSSTRRQLAFDAPSPQPRTAHAALDGLSICAGYACNACSTSGSGHGSYCHKCWVDYGQFCSGCGTFHCDDCAEPRFLYTMTFGVLQMYCSPGCAPAGSSFVVRHATGAHCPRFLYVEPPPSSPSSP